LISPTTLFKYFKVVQINNIKYYSETYQFSLKDNIVYSNILSFKPMSLYKFIPKCIHFEFNKYKLFCFRYDFQQNLDEDWLVKIIENNDYVYFNNKMYTSFFEALEFIEKNEEL